MLPQILASSYERYKQDTALFTTWLAQAAASCGFKSNSSLQQERDVPPTPSPVLSSISAGKSMDKPSSSRLKGKDRKLAKKAAEEGKAKGSTTLPENLSGSTIRQYTVTTKDLLSQAKAIAECIKPRVTLPASLQSIVQRAISARQRCTAWFRESNIRNKYTDEADKRHLHFISVLEESLKLLEPCMEAPNPLSQQHGIAPLQETNASVGVSLLTNRFEVLEVEEVPDIDSFSSSPSLGSPTKVNKSKGKPVIDVYELKDDTDDEDLAFMIFCMFLFRER